MTGVMINQMSGDRSVSFDEVSKIHVPKATRTYTPVANADLINQLKEKLAEKYKIDQNEIGMHLALSKDRQQLFGSLIVESIFDEKYHSSPMVCLRNSYNKTVSVALSSGANCGVCTNTQIFGEVKELRRHTTNVWDSVKMMVENVVNGSTSDFEGSMAMANDLSSMPISLEDGFKFTGLALGQEVIKPRQAAVIFEELKNPSHTIFEEENVWSLYNHFTEGLKRGPVKDMISRHENVNNFFKSEFLH